MASQVWKLSLSFIPAASRSATLAFSVEVPAVFEPMAWKPPARTAQSAKVGTLWA